MKKYSLIQFFILILIFNSTEILPQKNPDTEKPKVVVGIVVDQFKFEYLYRFNENYSEGGIKRLMNNGANFTFANYNYLPTYTGPGHATIYTGTTPFYHGITGNDMFFRFKGDGEKVYCAADDSVTGVGGGDEGKKSPKNLLTTTITDQLKLSNNGLSKVFSASIKDRGAIFPGGRHGDLVFWFEGSTGNFITSDYYMNELPDWVKEFNNKKLALYYSNKEWTLSKPIEKYKVNFPDDNPLEPDYFNEGKKYFPHSMVNLTEKEKLNKFWGYGYNDQFLTDFIIKAIDEENFGKNGVTDFIAISYTAPDVIGHVYGPNSVEVYDAYIKLDSQIERLLNKLDDKYGKDNYLVFLTADHGVGYLYGTLKRNENEHVPLSKLKTDLQNFAKEKYGNENVIHEFMNKQVFLNYKLLNEMNLNAKNIREEIANFLRENYNSILIIMTREDIAGKLPDRNGSNPFVNGFNPIRSGDVFIEIPPVYSFGTYGNNAVHSSLYSFDTHIPILFYGWNVPAMESNEPVYITDIAPTVADLLRIAYPSSNLGRPLLRINK